LYQPPCTLLYFGAIGLLPAGPPRARDGPPQFLKEIPISFMLPSLHRGDDLYLLRVRCSCTALAVRGRALLVVTLRFPRRRRFFLRLVQHLGPVVCATVRLHPPRFEERPRSVEVGILLQGNEDRPRMLPRPQIVFLQTQVHEVLRSPVRWAFAIRSCAQLRVFLVGGMPPFNTRQFVPPDFSELPKTVKIWETSTPFSAVPSSA